MKTPVPSQDAERKTAMENNPESQIQSPKPPQAGFTLLEILVATGVLSLMVTILFALFNEGSNAWRIGEKTADVNQTVRLAMDLMVREASSAVINTNTALAPNLPGLVVAIRTTSQASGKAAEPSRFGKYEEVCFVAPVDLGNEATNNNFNTYRAFCGVRYYVARAATIGDQQPVLGSLTREIYQVDGKLPAGQQFSLYSSRWFGGGIPNGCRATANVIAENVLSFRVQPVKYTRSDNQGLRPANEQMFKGFEGDLDYTINCDNFSITQENPTSTYPGMYIGLSVVDSRLASRINQSGLDAMSKSPQFSAATNWTLVHFENYNPKP